MGSAKQYTKKQIITALKESYGVISTVSQRLGCSWSTAQKYLNKWPDTRKALKLETEIMLDLAESALFNAIEKGNLAAAKWVLSTRGASRGYTDRVELTGIDESGKHIPVFIDLPIEELKMIEKVLRSD